MRLRSSDGVTPPPELYSRPGVHHDNYYIHGPIEVYHDNGMFQMSLSSIGFNSLGQSLRRRI